MNFYQLHNLLNEDSPDSLKGSFTPDLIESKNWLCQELKKHITNKPIIYILGSWYGNLSILIEKHQIPFSKICFVELDKSKLEKTKDILGTNKFEYIHHDATTLSYDDADIVVNTSSNEMNRNWLKHTKNKTLIAIQARNHATDPKVTTTTLKQFNYSFPLTETLYLGQKKLKDPDEKYIRFMKIGYK